MSYEELLSLVVSNKILQDPIQEIIKSEKNVLNLVTLNWKKELENFNLYQNAKNKKILFSDLKKYTHVSAQYILQKDQYFKILVFGTFSLNYSVIKDDTSRLAFTSRNCPPLDCIGTAFMSDLNSNDKHTLGDAKFLVNSCGATCCPYCSEYIQIIPRNKEHWCVGKTLIYNGEDIKGLFRHSVEKDFVRTNVLAVMLLTITSRQFYGEKVKFVKITGNIDSMILFREMCLNPIKKYPYKIVIDSVSEIQNKEQQQPEKINNHDSIKNDKEPETIKFDLGEEEIDINLETGILHNPICFDETPDLEKEENCIKNEKNEFIDYIISENVDRAVNSIYEAIPNNMISLDETQEFELKSAKKMKLG